jgi:hypothetical protein
MDPCGTFKGSSLPATFQGMTRYSFAAPGSCWSATLLGYGPTYFGLRPGTVGDLPRSQSIAPRTFLGSSLPDTLLGMTRYSHVAPGHSEFDNVLADGPVQLWTTARSW